MPSDETYHDDFALVRVQDALIGVGIDLDTAVGAITEMQNRGILFRERAPQPPPAWATIESKP